MKHPTPGFVFMLNRAAVSWGSNKQTSVALSSCEAELMVAGSEAAKEAAYLRRYQEELGYTNPLPAKLAMDNQAGIASIAHNPSSTRRRSTSSVDVTTSSSASSSSSEQQRISVPFVNLINGMTRLRCLCSVTTNVPNEVRLSDKSR